MYPEPDFYDVYLEPDSGYYESEYTYPYPLRRWPETAESLGRRTAAIPLP